MQDDRSAKLRNPEKFVYVNIKRLSIFDVSKTSSSSKGDLIANLYLFSEKTHVFAKIKITIANLQSTISLINILMFRKILSKSYSRCTSFNKYLVNSKIIIFTDI